MFSDSAINTFGSLISPATVSLNVQNRSITQSSTIINWTAGDDVNYSIQLGIDSNLLVEVKTNSSFANNGTHIQTGLVYNTFYYYNVSVWTSSGTQNSTLQNFTTLDQEEIVDHGGTGGGSAAAIEEEEEIAEEERIAGLDLIDTIAIRTDTLQPDYTIFIQAGGIKKRHIELENLINETQSVKVGCENEFCDYITFKNTNVMLAPYETQIVEFTTSLPSTSALTKQIFHSKIMFATVNKVFELPIKTVITKISFLMSISKEFSSYYTIPLKGDDLLIPHWIIMVSSSVLIIGSAILYTFLTRSPGNVIGFFAIMSIITAFVLNMLIILGKYLIRIFT